MRLLGWLLLASGGLLGLLALIAAVWFLLMTGGIWLGEGKFTEGLGSLLIGVVMVAIALVLAGLALFFGIGILTMTLN